LADLLLFCLSPENPYLCKEMKRTWFFIASFLLMSCTLQAQEKKQPWPLKMVKKLMTTLDSATVRGTDPQYISLPEKGWAVELRNVMNYSFVNLEAKELEIESIDSWGAKTHSGPTVSAGVWIGYRGYGLGLSKDIVGEREIKSFSFGATGGNYGVNFRTKEFKSNTPELRVEGDFSEGPLHQEITWETEAPLQVHSLFLDGYYMFNGKQFSYAAAYDQSLRQLRSAGSVVAGAMYYRSWITYENPESFPLIAIMNNVGKIKFKQASIGAGYAYNWVPGSGWLINAMVVPMVTIKNRLKTYTYEITEKGNLTPTGSQSYTNHIDVNADMRLSVSYQWKHSYARIYSHYNYFRYRKANSHGHTSDWTVYGALGFRF